MSLFATTETFDAHLMSFEGNKTFEKLLGYVDGVFSKKRYKVLKRMINTSPKLEDYERQVLLDNLEEAVIVNRNNGIYRTEKMIEWEKQEKAFKEREGGNIKKG